jgi:hypothetical protein
VLGCYGCTRTVGIDGNEDVGADTVLYAVCIYLFNDDVVGIAGTQETCRCARMFDGETPGCRNAPTKTLLSARTTNYRLHHG